MISFLLKILEIHFNSFTIEMQKWTTSWPETKRKNFNMAAVTLHNYLKTQMAFSVVQMHYDMLKFAFNDKLKDVEPAKLVAITAGTTFALAYLYSQLTDKVSPTLTFWDLWNFVPCNLHFWVIGGSVKVVHFSHVWY